MSSNITEPADSRLIRSLSLASIRVVEGSFSANATSPPPACEVIINTDTSWDPIESGFLAKQQLTATFQVASCIVGEIRCKLELLYTCELDVTTEEAKQAIDGFANSSTPFNAWPYLREFVSNALQRMGWPPMMLPLLKERIVSREPEPEQPHN